MIVLECMCCWFGFVKVVMLLGYIFLSYAGSSGDIAATPHRFIFTPNLEDNPKFSSGNFAILDDDIYEYDELVMAEFEFDRNIRTEYNTVEGQPNVTFILIEDDDSECHCCMQ